jgi:hypothetical protein
MSSGILGESDFNWKPEPPVDLPKPFGQDSIRILATWSVYSLGLVPPLAIC